MTNQQVALALIKNLSGQANNLTIPRLYVDFMGSLDGALFVSQCLYWSDRTSDPDGWFYKTYPEWKEEICLSEYEISKQVKRAKEIGFLQTKLKKANGAPTVHYRVDFDKFLKSIAEFLQNGIPRNSAIQSQESGQSLTETTTETTTEKTRPSQKTDYLSHVRSFNGKTSNIPEPNPQDQYWQHRDAALASFQAAMGRAGDSFERDEIVAMTLEEGFDLATWERALRETRLNWAGQNKPPLGRAIEVYKCGGSWEAWKAREYPRDKERKPDEGEPRAFKADDGTGGWYV